MLLGCDLSHWNNDDLFSVGQFQIHKLTTGAAEIDPQFERWLSYRRNNNYPCNGVYHYMTSVGLDYQIKNILYWLENYQLWGEMLFAIDYESTIAQSDVNCSVLYTFISELQEKMQFQPVVYCDINNLRKIIHSPYNVWFQSNVSWWIADYNSNLLLPHYYETITPIIRQYTSTPICDMDIFYGNVDGWIEFSSALQKI